MNSRTAPLPLIAITLLMNGCDDHDEMHDRMHSDGSREACAIFSNGPSLALVAVAPGAGLAPSVSSDEKRYDIRLPVGEPMSGSGMGSGIGSGLGERGFDGVVSLPIAETGEYTLYLDSDVQVAVSGADGAEIALGAMVMPVAGCSDALHHGVTFSLSVGTYAVRISSSSVENLRLVVEHEAAAEPHSR